MDAKSFGIDAVGTSTGNAMDPYGASIKLGPLTSKPYGIVQAETLGQYINPHFTYPNLGAETLEMTAKRLENNTKVWIHFAKMFAEKYTSWDLQVDPASPLKNVILRSKNKDFCIENNGTGIRVIGATGAAADRLAKDLKAPAPTTSWTLDSRHTFYGWALGESDVPEFIVTP